jgi:hypothetical protein
MKKIILLLGFIILLNSNSVYSQPANSPYPVIFVHGLNSDDMTWNTTLTQLSSAWILSSEHTLSAVLNARGGDTTEYIQDVVIPEKDVSGNFVNTISNSSVYTFNFGNFWNRNSSDPRIILYSSSTPGSSQSPSSQSSIYKQGFALKIFIDSVLRVTGSAKVILAGHSMGGLAIREYLQRIENGIHKWWVDPNDEVNGHKVAKVVTIGTPHLGTNVSSVPFTTIDFNSEAIRDMRISFSSNNAPFLFGNQESVVPTNYYNADINCNGTESDSIIGLSAGNSENSLMPLPLNITYTYITSNYLGLGTDLAVPLNKQWLFNGTTPSPAGISDTLLTNKNHIQETGDYRSLIRGLDEPDNLNFAYEVNSGKTYAGFITLQSKAVTSDTDFYKVEFSSGGKLALNLTSLNAGVSGIAIMNENGMIIISKSIAGSSDSVSSYVNGGNYFYRITGNSNQNTNFNSYRFTPNSVPAVSIDLTVSIEGFWNGVSDTGDTLRLYLRNNAFPFAVIDSAKIKTDAFGNSTANFIHATSGSYYLQIIHRNSIETWSSAPLNLANGNTLTFDLTSSQSNAFGNNLVLKSGKWCIFGGDINRDGSIDATDVSSVENDVAVGLSGYVQTDVTGDNFVDGSDLSLLENNAAAGVVSVLP